jgi:N-acetylglutamate synthase-like GNAT family acetyltransferase
MNYLEWKKGDFHISTDKERLDIDTIHSFLSRSYWAQGIPRAIVEQSIANALCFGVYHQDVQIGFARVISDYTTFAYISDVFILENHRNQGLSKWLVQCMLEHPDVQGLRRWLLVTLDAQGLYQQFGFRPLQHPETFMEIHDLDMYKNG